MQCLNCDRLMIFHPMKSGGGMFQCPDCKSLRGDAEDRPRFLWIRCGAYEWIHDRTNKYGIHRIKFPTVSVYNCIIESRVTMSVESKTSAKEIVEDALLKSNHS